MYRFAKKKEAVSMISLQTDLMKEWAPVKKVRGLSGAICDAGSEFWFSCALFHRVSAWEVRNPA